MKKQSAERSTIQQRAYGRSSRITCCRNAGNTRFLNAVGGDGQDPRAGPCRRTGFLPVFVTRTEPCDPLWDFPAFTFRRRKECVSGSCGSHGDGAVHVHRSTKRSSSL